MKYGIIGGGPAGLSMALFLKESSEVLERSHQPGGHAGSYFDQGYTFDYGPHIMFSRNKEILDFMIKILDGNVHQCRRNNKISFANRLIKYPFENNLSALPLDVNYECLHGYLFNTYKEAFPDPQNLKEWLLHYFGKGLCDHYLFPYNEKVWKIPVEALSMIWADRIPKPPAEDIIKSAIGYETEGYLHQLHYHYPLKGGYQSISEALAKRVDVTYGFAVQEIIKRGGQFYVSDGTRTRKYDQIITTMPIQKLAEIINIPIPDEVMNAINGLIVNPMHIVSLGIKGVDENQYTALYFPEADYWVNRISFPNTFSPYNAPGGHYSIQAEITCNKDSEQWNLSDSEILNHVKSGLIKRGIISSEEDIVYEKVVRKEFSYVVYDQRYEKNVNIIRNWFPEQGLHLAGRFSYFEYLNVDGILERNMEIAGRLNRQEVDLEYVV